MDAEVLYLQMTSKFPSWTSRVRSPSPALKTKKLKGSRKRRTSKYLDKKSRGIFDGRFQHVHCFLSSSEIR
jgi:hypothetical protein